MRPGRLQEIRNMLAGVQVKRGGRWQKMRRKIIKRNGGELVTKIAGLKRVVEMKEMKGDERTVWDIAIGLGRRVEKRDRGWG